MYELAGDAVYCKLSGLIHTAKRNRNWSLPATENAGG